MGYYYRRQFNFSTHSIHRIRQRLLLPNEEEFLLKEKVLDLIESSTEHFETTKYIYIKVNKKDIFLVIDIGTKTIITATPISPTKQLWLIENE
ncbi:hypothetical protein [Spiroplasma apis]|uniref:Uncharacterized protein n=1 Tax=Spiroplasma apis B31 TaxID=1276258 RepID=V5RIX8_SPIAP|nr:hypothetical protein [Spiroplasma apis]AHB36443.1 hypothetical protein SAPIS_v1c05980 [Spiroplasma apis B31]